jgi:predicted heme/steroid binding protein
MMTPSFMSLRLHGTDYNDIIFAAIAGAIFIAVHGIVVVVFAAVKWGDDTGQSLDADSFYK